jgi:ribulose-phosphate 3-epimerase
MERIISPSILAADFGYLQKDLDIINRSEAKWIHCDVMDGVFVPNISFGVPVIEFVNKISTKPLDVHLMIVEPDKHIDSFIKAGAKSITVHFEACRHLNRTIQYLKDNNIKAGVSLNPHTPVHLLEEIITELDMVLIMSVNPGFGGQKLIESSIDKIGKLKDLILKKKSNASIQVDGGVNLDNAGILFRAGVDNLVAGTTIFKSADPISTIQQLLDS